MKTIRDPIHGDIELSEAELGVLDTEALQRLRRIKQLSFCSLVYPGANHTRFEHSLGTMHLAGRIARRLGLEEAPIRMAGLVHDAGHLPFSHSLEQVFGLRHEENLKHVLKSPLGDAVDDGGFDKNRICDLARGKGPGRIVASEVDADRIDYLLRDSHYTGAAYGVIDADRIISVMELREGRLCFKGKGLIALEALLLGRNQMYGAVYFHHTVRIADAMLQEAMSYVREEFAPKELLGMGDEELKISARERSETAAELLGLLDRRQLYKVACTVEVDAEKGGLLELTGLEPHQLLLSRPELGRLAFSIPVEENGKIRNLTEVSKTAENLEKEMMRLEGAEVFTPPRLRERVSAACASR